MSQSAQSGSETYIQIVKFLVARTGCTAREIHGGTDLGMDLGVHGDDYVELMAEYSSRFDVDMAGYLWYFHHREEGSNLGGLFFRPPHRRVKYIPVTPEMLLKYALERRWNLEYPEHRVPKRRNDLVFNSVILVVFVIVVLYKCIR